MWEWNLCFKILLSTCILKLIFPKSILHLGKKCYYHHEDVAFCDKYLPDLFFSFSTYFNTYSCYLLRRWGEMRRMRTNETALILVTKKNPTRLHCRHWVDRCLLACIWLCRLRCFATSHYCNISTCIRNLQILESKLITGIYSFQRYEHFVPFLWFVSLTCNTLEKCIKIYRKVRTLWALKMWEAFKNNNL